MVKKGEEMAKEKVEKAEEDSFARRKAEAMLQKNNKKLGKHGIGFKVAMSKIHGHGSHQQKSPMQ